MNSRMISYQPASRWQDAFPSGNGTIGALVAGAIAQELVILNHDRLWLRSPAQEVPEIAANVPIVRRLLAEGRYQEASTVLNDALRNQGYTHRVDPYHPACAMEINTPCQAPFTNYRRVLDFETGEVSVQWRESGEPRERRCFVSRADDVVVLHIAGTAAHPVSCTLALAPHDRKAVSGMGSGKSRDAAAAPIDFRMHTFSDVLHVVGRYADGGEFGGVARVVAQAGSTTVANDALSVEGAEAVLVLIKLFANESAEEALPRLTGALAALPADYDRLVARHAPLHRELFLRARIQLAPGNAPSGGNERDLLDAYGGEVPTALIERMAAYGRYLLISSSAPGSLPANLQGVWNGDYAPAWSSDFHNDENIQMNYWAALPGNLPETTLPYFDYYDSHLDDYRANARALYGCRGILAPIAQSTHGKLHPGPWLHWTAGAGWLAQLYYDYWLYTGDEDFLRTRALPFLREVTLFYEDFLIEGPDGTLNFSPSLSPENVPDRPGASIVTVNATMDVAIAREVLTNLCAACERLGTEAEGLARWRLMLAKLPGYEVNADGALREWLHPDLPDNYRHRHQSHLYPLFPGWEVTPETAPALFDACRTAVEKRLTVGMQAQTGWSYAHMANIYARLGDGDRALECLERLLRSCSGPNLFAYHNDWRAQGLSMYWGHGSQPPFQIDANFGFTAAVLEMLLFSTPGWVKLLPALPGSWTEGAFAGLLCRGGLVVDARWDMTAGWLEATLCARADQTVTLVFPFDPATVTSEPTGGVTASDYGARARTVALSAGQPLTITVERED
jgi:alpha-L-fucosidase 2